VLGSIEPFIHNGRSYVVMTSTTPPATYPAAIFMASIDPEQPLLTQLTPGSPMRVRRDPEVFVTSSGPYVYFNRLTRTPDPSGSSVCLPCSEGVFRSDTALGPPL
jgi:hypothetical protein